MKKTFEEVFEDQTKYGTKIKTDEYHKNGSYVIVDQGQSQIAGYTDLKEGLFLNVPVVIFGDHTRIIKYVDEPFFLGADGVKVLGSKDPNANHKYLYYALKNAKIPNTGYNRHFKWLKEIQIEYPDKIQQAKVVEVLDRLVKVIEERQQELQKLDDLVKARFVEMFGDIHKNTIYPYKKIKEFTEVCSGGTPDRKNDTYWSDGTIPWVKTTELKNNILIDVEEHITSEGLTDSSAKIVPKGTILVAMYGQGKTRGMTAFLNIEASTNQACACILPCEEVNQKYLWQYLILSYEQLRDLANGGNQPNLNVNIIKNFSILIPSKEMQNEFERFMEQVDKTKTAIQTALNKTQELYDGLMQEYFG